MNPPCLTLPAHRLAARLLFVVTAGTASWAAADWVDVGADEQSHHFVDDATLARDGDVVRVAKRAVFTAPLTDGHEVLPMTVRESRGVVEVDCALRVHRVVEIELLDRDGRQVSKSGPMRRVWEDVSPGTPGARTLDYACEHTAALR